MSRAAIILSLSFHQIFWSYYCSFHMIFIGFYDTSNEEVKALEPNYKKLRQEHMDEKRRDIKEEVTYLFQ